MPSRPRRAPSFAREQLLTWGQPRLGRGALERVDRGFVLVSLIALGCAGSEGTGDKGGFGFDSLGTLSGATTGVPVDTTTASGTGMTMGTASSSGPTTGAPVPGATTSTATPPSGTTAPPPALPPPAPVCGNGRTETRETCDGPMVAADCRSATKGEKPDGVLACNATCDGFDTSRCYACGDGKIEGAEACEAEVPLDKTCEDLGFSAGTLACIGCKIDTSGCCGDAKKGGAEACDGADLGGLGCDALEAPNGGKYTGGALSCKSDCTFDEASCTYCGDGAKNGAEECDSSDSSSLDGLTCQDPFDFLGPGGVLGCDPKTCKVDTGACVAPKCGETLTPAGACPSICDNKCADGVCEIRCDGGFDDSKCHGVSWNGGQLTCPGDWPCRIVCGDCRSRKFVCPSAVGATCELQCASDFTSCWQVSLTCAGPNACKITECERAPDPGIGGAFVCGSSCDCSSAC